MGKKKCYSFINNKIAIINKLPCKRGIKHFRARLYWKTISSSLPWAALHHLIFDYFPITTHPQVIYSLINSLYNHQVQTYIIKKTAAVNLIMK